MPNWKKLIVSGSNATLSRLTVDNSITASLLNVTTSVTASSYTGSFVGDGSGLTGIESDSDWKNESTYLSSSKEIRVTGTISGSTKLQIGSGHTNSGTLSSIGGGDTNTITSTCGFIGSGCNNRISNIGGFIGGGKSNCVQRCFSTIAGGIQNCTNSEYGHDFIGGGKNNSISGSY